MTEKDMFKKHHEERLKEQEKRAIDQTSGLEALKRLLPIAQGNSGQCRIVAAFLLGLYNGRRFPFDMNEFRGLDTAIFDDCLTVLRMDSNPRQEVHTYFENGGKIWEGLAVDWNIKNHVED